MRHVNEAICLRSKSGMSEEESRLNLCRCACFKGEDLLPLFSRSIGGSKARDAHLGCGEIDVHLSPSAAPGKPNEREKGFHHPPLRPANAPHGSDTTSFAWRCQFFSF